MTAATPGPGDAPDVKLEKLGVALSETGAATLADIGSCAALLSIPTGELPAPDPTPQRQKDLTIAMLIFLTAFEVLVAFLQAYIFAMLTGVYIGSSMEGHADDH